MGRLLLLLLHLYLRLYLCLNLRLYLCLLPRARPALELLVVLAERRHQRLLLLLEVLVLHLRLPQPRLDVVGPVLLVLLLLAVVLDHQELQQKHQRLDVWLLGEQHKDGLDGGRGRRRRGGGGVTTTVADLPATPDLPAAANAAVEVAFAPRTRAV